MAEINKSFPLSVSLHKLSDNTRVTTGTASVFSRSPSGSWTDTTRNATYDSTGKVWRADETLPGTSQNIEYAIIHDTEDCYVVPIAVDVVVPNDYKATGFSTHSATDVWSAGTRTLTANTNLNDPTAAAIADAVWDEATSGHTATGSFGKLVSDISGLIIAVPTAVWSAGTRTLTSFGSLVSDIWSSGTRTLTANTNLNDPTAAAIADAVWDETMSDHTTAGSTGATLNGLVGSGPTGPGAVTFVYTCKDDEGNVIADAEVWVTSDSAGANQVAGTLLTNAAGQVTFTLNTGTQYLWRQKSGVNFTNPVSFDPEADA